MMSFGRVAARGFLVAAAGIAFAVREASRFRQEMALVNTMLSGAGIKQFTSDIRKMSAELGIAKDELAKGLYQVLSAQIPPENAIAFLAEATKAAIGGATETEQSVKAVVKVMESWNMTTADTAKITDKLFRIIEKGVISYDELSAKIGVVSGLAAKAGVSIDELGGVIATASKTVNADVLFTGLRSALLALLKPGPLLRQEFEKLGTTGSKLIEKKGIVGALETLNELAGGSVDTFAELVGNARSLPVVLAVTGQGAEKAADNIAAMADSAGAAERAFQKMDIARQWPRLWQSILVLVERFGDVISRVAQPAVEGLSKLLQQIADSPKFNAFLERIGKTTRSLIGVVGALFQGGEARDMALEGFKDIVVGAFEIAADRVLQALFKGAPLVGLAIGRGVWKAARGLFGKGDPEQEAINEGERLARRFSKPSEEVGKMKITLGKWKMQDAGEMFEKGLEEFKSNLPGFVEGLGDQLKGKTGEEDIIDASGGLAAAPDRSFSELRRIGANILGAGAGENIQKKQLSVAEKTLKKQDEVIDAIKDSSGGGKF
jgi:TP901 family phage tail tape measure protein